MGDKLARYVVMNQNVMNWICRKRHHTFSSQVSETEIFIEHCEFKFYSKPYYLRYALPLQVSCLMQALTIVTLHDSLKCSYEVVRVVPMWPFRPVTE